MEKIKGSIFVDKTHKRILFEADDIRDEKQISEFLASQGTLLNENRTTLDGLRQKAELFAQRTPTQYESPSEFDDIGWIARDLEVADDEVEVAYLQEKSKRCAS